jgi:hypothetical protein
MVPFSPKHHALLFAWISKAVHDRVESDEAEVIIKKAVRRYGEERGGRMALRAKANGHKLSMLNYLAYGEWRAEPGASQQEVVERTPRANIHVRRCPWHEAWREYDLLDYGKLYCQEVDEALVRGFNPDLRIEVRRALSEGESYCDFVFHETNLTLLNSFLLRYRQVVRPGKRAVMPWDYHLGHLFKTMGEVVGEELGQLGLAAMDAALKNFTETFGKEAGEAIEAYSVTDFNYLPD